MMCDMKGTRVPRSIGMKAMRILLFLTVEDTSSFMAEIWPSDTEEVSSSIDGTEGYGG
jgi:hypothetical protein